MELFSYLKYEEQKSMDRSTEIAGSGRASCFLLFVGWVKEYTKRIERGTDECGKRRGIGNVV